MIFSVKEILAFFFYPNNMSPSQAMCKNEDIKENFELFEDI